MIDLNWNYIKNINLIIYKNNERIEKNNDKLSLFNFS